jgi:hypothetical protein
MSDVARRDSSKTAWAIVAVIAIVAIVALGVVYMNSKDREDAARQDTTVQFEAGEDSALAAQAGAERAERAAEATGEALAGAADAGADVVADAAADADTAITLRLGGSGTTDTRTAP